MLFDFSYSKKNQKLHYMLFLTIYPYLIFESFASFISRIGTDYFYDNGRFLYCLRKLIEEGKTKDVESRIEDPLGKGELKIKYRLKLVNKVSAGSIQEYIRNAKACTNDIPQESINMVDTLLKYINGEFFAYFTKTGGFHGDAKVVSTRDLFSIYSGFSFSVRPQWKCRLNVDMVSMWAFDWLHC